MLHPPSFPKYATVLFTDHYQRSCVPAASNLTMFLRHVYQSLLAEPTNVYYH